MVVKSIDSELFWDDKLDSRIRRRYLVSIGADPNLKTTRWANLSNEIRSLLGRKMNARRWGHRRSLLPVYDADANVVAIPNMKVNKVAPALVANVVGTLASQLVDNEDDEEDTSKASLIRFNSNPKLSRVLRDILIGSVMKEISIQTDVSKMPRMNQDYIDNFYVKDEVITPIGKGVLVSTGATYADIAVNGELIKCDLLECIKANDALFVDSRLICWDMLDNNERSMVLDKTGIKLNDISTTWSEMVTQHQNIIKSTYPITGHECAECGIVDDYVSHMNEHKMKSLHKYVDNSGGKITIPNLISVTKSVDSQYASWKNNLETTINNALTGGLLIYDKKTDTLITRQVATSESEGYQNPVYGQNGKKRNS